MKTFIFLVIFLGPVTVTVSAQKKDPIMPETFRRKVMPDHPLLYPNPPSFGDTLHWPCPDWSPGRFATKRSPGDNMRIIRPRGYYPMIVIKPDTVVHYTLIIKKP
jgi:hypothetical protein